jgi:hypothetical protein
VVGSSNSTLSAAANIQAAGTGATSSAADSIGSGADTIGAAGSGTPNMPPYLGVAYYIRAL